MNFIAEKIMSYLDSASLHNCEMVSKTWYWVIQNGRLWKKMFNKLSHERQLLNTLFSSRFGSKSQDENDELIYKRICNVDHIVDKNWKSGKYSTYSKNLGEGSVSLFEMDKKRIVFGLRNSASVPSSVMVYNRWTLEFEHALVGHQEWITSMQLCGDLIFCSYYDGTVLIWDLKTKEVVQQFQDQEVVDWVVVHSNHGMLISSTSVASGPYERDSTVTIRRFLSPTDMAVLRQDEIPNAKINRIQSDKNGFIVFLMQNDSVQFQIRSKADFQCVHTIEDIISIGGNFAYCSGQLVTASDEGAIKIWDIETKKCKISWPSGETIDELRLTAQHIIARNSTGKITVWDIPTVKNELQELCTPKKLFQIEGEEVDTMDPSLDVDELQILTVSVKEVSRAVSTSTLSVCDFLGRIPTRD